MKHLILLLAAVGMMFLLTACSSVDYCSVLEKGDYSDVTKRFEELAIISNEEAKIKIGQRETEEPKYVAMTIPSNYVDTERTQEDWDDLSDKMGCKSITLNEDGSVSYVMTEAAKKSWMEEAKQFVNITIDSYADMLEYSPYKDFSANDDYSVIGLVTHDEKKDFTADSGYSVYDIIQAAKIYNTYAQKEIANVDVVFGYMDDEIYKAYLDEYAAYLKAYAKYENDMEQYKADKKQYEKDIETYKKDLSDYEKKVKEYENLKTKYENIHEATWVDMGYGDYQLNDVNGDIIKNAWVQNAKYWYLMDENGYMVRDSLRNVEGTHYYFDNSGIIVSGDNDKFYLSDEEPTEEETQYFVIEPIKPTEPIAPKEPKIPTEPKEPIEPKAETFCTVSSSKLFDGRRAE